VLGKILLLVRFTLEQLTGRALDERFMMAK